MSAKWRRSQAWDDAFFPAWAAPIKFVFRAFSSITLAVVLLTFVALYGALASVPMGLMVLGMTWSVYVFTLLSVIAVVAALPTFVLWAVMRGRGLGIGARFAAAVPMLLVLGTFASWGWWAFAWPSLHFDPVTGSGFRLFPAFVAEFGDVTIRRLPGFEMTELEFYSWWPMRLALMLFVINMIFATVRRIEFNFKNIGVLTVHTGIVVISLGSVYYQSMKKEGDTLLLAGQADAQGNPTVGPPQRAFFDNVRTALYVSQFRGWQQRVLENVPRYNSYGLDVASGPTAWDAALLAPRWDERDLRPLDRPVRPATGEGAPLVDGEISFRVVGYAPYAEPTQDWLLVDPSELSPGSARNPLRIVKLFSRVPDASGAVDDQPAFSFTLVPGEPKSRIADNGIIGVEYLPGDTPSERLEQLATELPGGAEHGLIVTIPGTGENGATRRVLPIFEGARYEMDGYVISVQQILPEPPFPIVTEGFEGSTSSVAVVRVEAPATADKPAETFDRYCYFRFPEITQDLMVGQNLPDGRPSRRDADPRIELTYIDHSRIQIMFRDNADGTVAAIARAENGIVRREASLPRGADGFPVFTDFVPQLDFRVTVRAPHAEPFERPVLTPEPQQEGDFVGTHEKSMLAVEVSAPKPGGGAFTRVVWLPFTKYLSVDLGATRRVDLPDGRSVELLFGRAQHRIPGFEIRLVDFEMVAYDHRGAPRDYRSIVQVDPLPGSNIEAFTHETKLNAPLTAPFNIHDREQNPVVNLFGRLASGMNPNQFKFSQAGWDRSGWEASQAAVDRGELVRPAATFTILGVGNNPGIHLVALGSVLVALGIPWAFYIKPWLVRRERDRLKAAALAESKPAAHAAHQSVHASVESGASV